jgi:1-acyl-sn-glycerol-3-phosphate acyltransferase
MKKLLEKITYRTVAGIVRIVFHFLGGFRTVGTTNVPRSGGVLICPNHLSDADPPAVGIAVPRRCYFMAKEELFSVRILGSLLRHWKMIPIKRDSADRSALRRAEELLKAGEAVVIFPEGGGNVEGTLQPLHSGALMLALRCKVPVVPVALVNTNRVWTYTDPLPHRAGVPVTVTFGEPMDFSDLYGKKGAIDEATQRLTVRLAEMLNQPIPQGKPQPRSEEAEPATAARRDTPAENDRAPLRA